MRFRFNSIVLPVLVSLAMPGCGPNDGRQALSGKVLLDGKPLANASISFYPVGHEANSSGMAVRDGVFNISADKGLVPGKYAVSVQAFQETGRMYDDPGRGGKVPEFEPIVFGQIEPVEITISARQRNEFEIKLSP